MSAPIRVELPSRGAVLEFEAGTPESVISSVIRRDFQRNGSDVAFDLGQDENFDRNMTVDDFKLYEQYMQEKKSNFLSTAAAAAGSVANVIGKGILGLVDAQNLNPAVAVGTVAEAGAQGTRQLYGMLAQSEDPNSVFFRFKDWINGTGKPEDRLQQWKEAREFARKTEALDRGEQTVTGIPSEYVNNDVKNALSLVADPTLLIPGVGEIMGAGRLASRAFGAGLEASAKTARLVTAPVAGAVDAAAEAALRATGPNAAALRGAAAATGLTGVIMGVPGVREATGIIGGVKLADKVAEIAARAGQNLAEGGSRIGPMEAVGMAPNAGKIDRAVGTIGRYGGDRALDLGLAGGAGALEGSVIGAGLGYLSGGEEGAAAGFGSGAVLGGVAGTGVRAFDTVTGKVAAENRAADFERFLKNSDETTRSNFEAIAERDGLDAAVNTMDIRNLLQGSLKDATFTVLDDAAFQERFGNNARGVQVITAGQPEVVINSSKMASNYTAGHELFHALDAVEQLRPQAERIKQEIVGTFVTQPDGKVVQASEGLLSPAEVEARFNEYKSKAPTNAEWDKASTFAEKARLVANELGAEYMGRLISGSNPDEMLRGFSGVTRTLMDMALTRDASSRIRQLAEGLGLGSKPIESIVFKDLQAASPALNGMLRDLVRARRNLSERMELADGRGEVITRNNINSPAVAQKAVEMGVAARNADGSVSMKPDDVLAREDAAATSALRDVVTTTPVADVTKPHLRVVDGKVTGAGISPEQLAAIQSAPGMSNKVKEALTRFSDSISAQAKPGEGNVLFIEYGAATKRAKSRITGSWKSVYSSGIRVSQREIAPYQVYVSEAGNVVAKVVDISKLRADASDLASKGRLGPYGADLDGFLADSVRYFDNISDPNGVRTRELPGMTPERAAFLNQHFGQDEKGGAKFIRDIRLDRVIQIRPTGERIAASELAWQRQKVNWMPEEKLPEGAVISSNEGFRIISKNGKFSLYSPDGQRVGIYDTQAKAEQKAALQADKFAGEEARNVPINEDLPAGQREDVAKWISTRKPTAKNAHEDALKQNLAIDSKAVLLDSDATRTVANLVKKYPGFKTTKTKPAEIVAEFRDFVVDNLLYLHDSMAPELRDRAQKWYDGARVITERWSEKYGVKREAVAAVLASLSPQTDWFRNVSQAQRVIEVFKNQQNTAMTPQMEGWLINYYAGDGDGAKIVDAMRGKRFADLTTYEKAVWTRAFDQNHNDRKYNILTPEGEFATLVTNKDGSPATLAWGNFNTIANAISVLENPSRMTISERLGGEHKVRSFYNNILLPMLRSYGDVTIDTHAVAAALLRPLAGADTEVTHNLGAGISSSVSGASGIYGIYADAYRIAAEMRGILPRQMQSITWEAVRGLFEATWKTQANKALVNSIWNEYKSGKISKDEARSQITKAAGGITTPDWARPDNRGTEKAGPSSDSGEVPQADAGRSSSRANQRGVGNAAAGEFASANLMPDAADEYRGQHTAPGRDSAPAHDLIGNGVYPKDVYQRPDWYEQGDGLAVMRRVLALKDRPDAKVAIYRAIPTEVYKREMAAAEKSGEPFLNRVIRPGDWVTIDKIYAKEHGESALNGDFKVVHKNVPASHIFTNGDSIMEWGYHPDTAKAGQRNFMPDTLEFRRRLQGTKVSDKYGAPLRVYHGSPQSGLSELKANDGAIFFTDSADVAKGYTAKRGIWMSKPTGEVRSAFLDVKNPLEIDALGKRNDNIPVPWQEWKSKVYGNLPANAVSVEVAAKRAKEMGHDALIVRNVIDTADTDGKKKSTVFAVFDPSQVMLHGEEPKPQVNFMPEAMPNGTVYRSNIGFTVFNKNGGKFRVYSPVGTLIAVANSLEEAQRMIERKTK